MKKDRPEGLMPPAAGAARRESWPHANLFIGALARPVADMFAARIAREFFLSLTLSQRRPACIG